MKALVRKLLSEKRRNAIRTGTKRLIYPLYLGNRFACNCCGKKFRKLITWGNVARPNARCPYCDSLERTRVLDLFLDRELDLYKHPKGRRVLHIAPEPSLFKKLVHKQLEYIDGDINLAHARYIVDLTRLDYPDDHFDLIICSHVLGHIPDEAKAISEMHRTLKPKGLAIVMTVHGNSAQTIEDTTVLTDNERLLRYGEHDLVRLHGTADFAQRLQAGGFAINRTDYRLQLPAELQQKNRLGDGKRELIYQCTKH